jgi:enoyl-[acyl-carrier protein] reductase I
MVKEFDGYWALILGGSSGLGYASALKLAQHGMNICILHRNPGIEMEAVQERFEKIRTLGVELLTYNADVLNAEKRLQVLKQLNDKIDKGAGVRCLLHSIAKGNLKPMLAEGAGPALQTDDFQITMNNMAFSLYDWVNAVYEAGLFAADARVISFTSEGGRKAIKHYAAVSAAKAALEAITRNIALEFAPYGIRANCLQAGVTDTPSLRRIPGNEQLIGHSLSRNPFKRLTTPEDLAGMVYLLCKDEAAWLNGAMIPVDGGEQIN